MIEGIFEALFEIIGEVLLNTIFEPIDHWITLVTNKKTKKYTKRLRSLIRGSVTIVFMVLLVGYIIGVFSSIDQRIAPEVSRMNAAVATLFLLINTLLTGSAIPRTIFGKRPKLQKCIIVVVLTLAFLLSVLFLFMG